MIHLFQLNPMIDKCLRSSKLPIVLILVISVIDIVSDLFIVILLKDLCHVNIKPMRSYFLYTVCMKGTEIDKAIQKPVSYKGGTI